MKVEELMIGDWVIDTRSNTPVRVNPFLAQLEVPEWKPIPLTPEILRENHWIGHKDSWLHRHCDFLICQYEDRTYDLYFDGDKDSGYITIRFVHELQHALRLCGINLEINI